MLITDFISIYIPATLPILLLTHLLALISPGPDFFIVTGHALRGKFNGSVFICIGIGLAHAIYITISMLGWSAMAQRHNLLMRMQVLGALYLIYVGFVLIKNQATNIKDRKVGHTIGYLNQLVTGFVCAILNPKNMLFYFSLTGLLLGNQSTTIHKITAAISMILMVLFYNFLLVKLISLTSFTIFLQNKMHYFEKIAGSMLLLIALIIFKNIFIQ